MKMYKVIHPIQAMLTVPQTLHDKEIDSAARSNSTNLVISGVQQVLDQMKYEI
jgi:hypothetical protein